MGVNTAANHKRVIELAGRDDIGIQLDFFHVNLRCNHEPILWSWKDVKGVWQSATRAHLPLVGRVRDSGDWATKAAAAYPFRTNVVLAKALVAAGRARPNRHLFVRPTDPT